MWKSKWKNKVRFRELNPQVSSLESVAPEQSVDRIISTDSLNLRVYSWFTIVPYIFYLVYLSHVCALKCHSDILAKFSSIKRNVEKSSSGLDAIWCNVKLLFTHCDTKFYLVKKCTPKYTRCVIDWHTLVIWKMDEVEIDKDSSNR